MRLRRPALACMFVVLSSAVDCSRAAEPGGPSAELPPVRPSPPRGAPEVAAEVGATVAPKAGTWRCETAACAAPFHLVGRFDGHDPAGPRLGWPGTEVRARFVGGGIAIDLADSGVSHYDVAIDGAPPSLLVVTGDRRLYDLAADLASGSHEVVLTKRTEAATGVTQLFGFAGALVPSPPPSGRRLELVGDSITCGFGVLGPDASCSFSADTESEPHAWGALAARALGALHMVTAVSGVGVLRNFDGSSAETMPERYDRALPDEPTSSWPHRRFEPDVIVVNLGTNDFAGGKGDPGPAFRLAYTKMLAHLREVHGEAHIVVATSPMLDGESAVLHRAYLQDALAVRATAGDLATSLVDLGVQSALDGHGCAYHPSVTTQKKMSAKLAAHVKALMGW